MVRQLGFFDVEERTLGILGFASRDVQAGCRRSTAQRLVVERGP